MPIRFPTEAANADILGEDTEMTKPVGAQEGSPRRFQRSDESRARGGGEAKPGKDINQAGFIKDKDSAKP